MDQDQMIISRMLQAHEVIPGETVYISNEEGHCFWWALGAHCEREDFTPYFYIEHDEIEQATDMWTVWDQVFTLEDIPRIKEAIRANREHTATMDDARKQLWELCEKRFDIRDDLPM